MPHLNVRWYLILNVKSRFEPELQNSGAVSKSLFMADYKSDDHKADLGKNKSSGVFSHEPESNLCSVDLDQKVHAHQLYCSSAQL